MTIGDLRKIIAGLDDDTEIKIKDEATEETYGVHKMNVIAFERSAGRIPKEETKYWMQLITNIELQTECYSMDETSR